MVNEVINILFFKEKMIISDVIYVIIFKKAINKLILLHFKYILVGYQVNRIFETFNNIMLYSPRTLFYITNIYTSRG